MRNKLKEELKKEQLQIVIEGIVNEVFLEEQGVLYKAFVEPFTDVIKTAQHGLESSIQSITRNSRKIAMQAAAAAIPFIAPAEVTRIGEDESRRLKERLNQIDSKYADVLDRNIKALQGSDPTGIAFLLNPSVTLGVHAGAWAAGKGLSQASSMIAGNLEFLAILTSHVPAVSNIVQRLSQQFDTLSNKAAQATQAVVTKKTAPAGFTGGGGGGYGDYGDYGGDFGEAKINHKPVIKEEVGFTPKELNQKMGSVLQQLLNKPSVQKAISSSPVTKALKETAIATVLDRANKVNKFTNIEQFKQFAGPEFSQYEQKIKTQIPKDADPKSIANFEQQQVVELKKVYKEIYKKYLKDLASSTPGMGEQFNKAIQVLDKMG